MPTGRANLPRPLRGFHMVQGKTAANRPYAAIASTRAPPGQATHRTRVGVTYTHRPRDNYPLELTGRLSSWENAHGKGSHDGPGTYGGSHVFASSHCSWCGATSRRSSLGKSLSSLAS